MATKIIKPQTRLLILRAYNLKYLCRRTFSSQNNGPSENKQNDELMECAKVSKERWLNIRAGIFGPFDERLPLPGDIGMSHNLYPTSVPKPVTQKTESISRMLAENEIEDQKSVELMLESLSTEVSATANEVRETLECRVQSCPKLLKKDFVSLFTNLNIPLEDELTVLTICQKTENDMSGWSEKVEVEREKLIEIFVHTANKLCDSLINEGFWADFIDPMSGRAYLGDHTNSTLFETDERYRNFGFDIDDLGCCKVITHKKWGSKIFVGALFTNASVNSEVFEDILQQYNMVPVYKS